MDEVMFKVPLKKVLDLILSEERAKIKNFYASAVGQSAADMLNNYVPTESEVLKMFTIENK